MPITFQNINADDVATLKARADVMLKTMSEKRLKAVMVYLFWSLYGDQGADIDVAALNANTDVIEQQLSEDELNAALAYALWSSTGA